MNGSLEMQYVEWLKSSLVKAYYVHTALSFMGSKKIEAHNKKYNFLHMRSLGWMHTHLSESSNN